MLGTIVWIIGFGYYQGCQGLVTRIEPIPGYNQDMTIIRNVKCGNGDKFDYIVGIPSKYLRAK